MCGIVGVVSNAPVNQLIYDALLLLQHRGQDAAGIATQMVVERLLAAEGISAEVVDPRTLVPLDADTLVRSAEIAWSFGIRSASATSARSPWVRTCDAASPSWTARARWSPESS